MKRRKIRVPRSQQPIVQRINNEYSNTRRTDDITAVARPRTATGPDIKLRWLNMKCPKPTGPIMLPNTTAIRCAIVGNATSIFQKQHGETIDSFDTVVRINTIRVRESACQGKRTDVLFVHDGTINTIPRRVYKTITDVVNINTDIPDLYTYWATRIKQEINEDARVTTGFMTILAMMQVNYHITLFGFDWYETPTYYTNRGPWKKHHPDWEKNTILPLLEAHNASLCNIPEEQPVLPDSI